MVRFLSIYIVMYIVAVYIVSNVESAVAACCCLHYPGQWEFFCTTNIFCAYHDDECKDPSNCENSCMDFDVTDVMCTLLDGCRGCTEDGNGVAQDGENDCYWCSECNHGEGECMRNDHENHCQIPELSDDSHEDDSHEDDSHYNFVVFILVAVFLPLCCFYQFYLKKPSEHVKITAPAKGPNEQQQQHQQQQMGLQMATPQQQIELKFAEAVSIAPALEPAPVPMAEIAPAPAPAPAPVPMAEIAPAPAPAPATVPMVEIDVPAWGGGGSRSAFYKQNLIFVDVPMDAQPNTKIMVPVPELYR